MTNPTTTTTALDLHNSIVATEKAQKNNWTTMGNYFLCKGWDSDEIVPPKKANGTLDNAKFVEAFKKELGEGDEYKKTTRAFQKYISTIFGAKAILMAHGPCAIELKGEEIVVDLPDLWNWEGTGNIAPKSTVFEQIIRSMKEQESALKAITRAVGIIEKAMPNIESGDKVAVDVLMGQVSQAYAQLTLSLQPTLAKAI